MEDEDSKQILSKQEKILNNIIQDNERKKEYNTTALTCLWFLSANVPCMTNIEDWSLNEF